VVMIEQKLNVAVMILVLIAIIVTGIIVVDDSSKDETERYKYSNNVIIDDMCYEEYNKSYIECNYTEKKQIIRKYRLTQFEHEQEKPTQIMPVFIPT